MNTKLTLSIDKNVITRAKNYARHKNKSLSQIIEDYLRSISNSEKNSPMLDEIPPVTQSLSGILKGMPEIDFKNEISDYVMRKHK